MSRRSLAFGLCFLLMCSVFIPISLGSNVKVSKMVQPSIIGSGNTLYVGGYGPDNYTKIQDAINDSVDGDIVFVYDDSSPYHESIQINKSINLIGEDRNTTIIDANGNSHNILIKSDVVSIHEFTLQNPNLYGIYDIGFGFCTFSDNIIINTFGGIRMLSSNNNTIDGNTFFNYELFGIDLRSSDNNTISGNFFGNFSDRNDNWGISMRKSKGNNITYNTFKENMMGIGLDQSSDNLILNNIISFNRETGMWIGESSNNTIIGNIISSCADYGIFIRTVDSKNNIIFHNNFEYNQVNANDIGNNTWDDGYPSGGNFWHDYKGEDFDGDGIGDTPYPIPGGDNEDRYPLINPLREPKAPIIDGPSSGKPGGEICFTFNSTDPDGDEVKYRINWGDGTIVETGYYLSCVPVEVCHTWNENNTYTILARAEDIRGYRGDWSEFKIKISNPRTRTFLRFLDMFPILQRILSYIL